MIKKILSLLTAVLLMAGLFIPTMASAATKTMYVYTENGKGLHIRYEPSTDAEILTDAKFGEKITVKKNLGNGWTAIYWGGDDVFYVQSRFLVKNKPTKKPTAKTTTTKNKTKTIKKLKKGKQYQIRVRAYKSVSGSKYYGAWSKVKTTKKVK